jgi:hypothetical protein
VHGPQAGLLPGRDGLVPWDQEVAVAVDVGIAYGEGALQVSAGEVVPGKPAARSVSSASWSPDRLIGQDI